MEKILFFNFSNLNSIIYDADESSWKQTPRLSSIRPNNGGEKLNVCLFDLPHTLPDEHIISLFKMSDWANLFTVNSGFTLENGFYPIMLADNTMYFTDKEEYSLLNGDWALDNVYKVVWNNKPIPAFNRYAPQFPQGWQQGIIEAQNIRVGELFEKVSGKLVDINDFCKNNQNAQVEIIYSDRYVKTELALVICLQFIKDLIAVLHPSSYRVKMIGEFFSEPRANDEGYRRLGDSFISDGKRDEIGNVLINDDKFVFESKEKKEIPHYRELMVKAGNNVLRIMPDAGLAHWGLDVQQCQADRQFYGTNNGINSRIPICSSTEQVYYICLR